MLREEPPLRRRLVGQFFVAKALVFVELMCIRIFEGFTWNPARSGRRQVANDRAAKIILGEAQTFADLMPIST